MAWHGMLASWICRARSQRLQKSSLSCHLNSHSLVHVCAGARIGSGVSLGQNAFVGNQVIIGNHCKIQNNVSVYDGVTLEEGVFCGPSMVFTNVYNPRSLIERSGFAARLNTCE